MGPRMPGAGTDSMATPKSGNTPAWKAELAEKLAASRSRRSGLVSSARAVAQPRLPLDGEGADGHRASVAAAVAARYADQPTYREVLEKEAIAAALAAEEALMAAQAAQEAVRRRMDDARAAEAAAAEAREQEALAQETHSRQAGAGMTRPEDARFSVHFPLDERTERQMQAFEARQTTREPQSSHQPSSTAERMHGRPAPPRISDPFEEATVAPATPLAANLIEFPRELVATRKARPRLAEGPLREDHAPGSQLRIFEVEPDSYQRRPDTPAAAGAKKSGLDWSSIRLDSAAPQQPARAAHPSAQEAAIAPAPIEDRIMAAVVDGALSFAGFLLFVFVFSSCTAHPPTGKLALAGSVIALLVIFYTYQWLFFRFGSSTPGMVYARIALCTMDDNNPTRRAMQRRIGALLLATLPLGLGVVWAVFDDDHLGWHDRISGTYQRSYR